ncbi:hypothetical protein BDV96DRAFT_490266 [Lophiotrema nucula]|uniref:NAD(P)-binding protein n=1 Tax=Lophiotrema nucula TaxID=690887 RepID=A0A6A5ZE85_9PLEO|nr:hypothetical protein BDV96DRAFT_490266 [Lophiotrema nucula]
MSKRSGPLAPGVAFITGGARGLGNAVACSFAKEGARAVVIADIQDEKTFAQGKKNVEEIGCECLTIHCDVTKEDQVEAAVKQAVDKFGRIDYAANFAGIIGPSSSITETNTEEWLKCQAVNSTGVFLATKHELRQMMKQSSIDVEDGRVEQRGSIVNCASVNSLMAIPTASAYTTSKHACHGITKTAALEARSHGIRVNAVSPGFLLTPMIENGVVGGDMDLGMKLWEGFEKRQGRKAKFEEVGDVVVLLSLPRCSLVNGQNLFIDGGFTINEGFE